MSVSFINKKRDEIAQLQTELMSSYVEEKREALKKIIGAMTVGKDVSMLFMDVLKCMETPSLELKKLIYLFIINYSKTQPDLALLSVNTLRKDSRQSANPLLRALAVRTMGCIGVESITEYLCDPLRDALNDSDAYVRKTAAVCVAKLFEIKGVEVERFGFIERLIEMTADENAMVIANSIIALQEISILKGPVITMDSHLLGRLLVALAEASEWSRVYILDFLAANPPGKYSEIEEVVSRVVPNLSHSNSAVVLSSIRALIKYMNMLTDPEKVRSVSRKITPALVSLMNSEPEIQYIALRCINLILQKHPNLIDRDVKIFFCNFNDPLYVKLGKLEVIIRLADYKNVDQILMEFKEYAQEIDIVMVKRSVQAIGRLAIKLDAAAERCMSVLLDLIKTEINYILQEAICVIKDIFRKYPNKYEGMLKEICRSLKTLDDDRAKEAYIWILGEYSELIDNAFELLCKFVGSFHEEITAVQHQILTASAKYFLYHSEEEEFIQRVFKLCTEESDNPDLRDRGFIYWRLLAGDLEFAKSLIFGERPPISEDAGNIETELLDPLIENISCLSSIYYKKPEHFVPKIKQKANERFDLENLDNQHDETAGSTDCPPTFKPEEEKKAENAVSELLDIGSEDNEKTHALPVDLNLLDL